jgi:hypothetical protein
LHGQGIGVQPSESLTQKFTITVPWLKAQHRPTAHSVVWRQMVTVPLVGQLRPTVVGQLDAQVDERLDAGQEGNVPEPSARLAQQIGVAPPQSSEPSHS